MTHLRVVIAEKRYPGDRVPVLRDVELELQRGQLVALFGPSGCGKSTCLRIVAGLDTAFLGDLSLDGRYIDGPTRRIGVVFQEQVAFNWLTVAGNIQFGDRFARGNGFNTNFWRAGPKNPEVEELAELVGLNPPDLKKYPRELSGGMKQRMSFARALATQPEVLLLDEPFSSLDFESRQDLQDVVLRINQKLNTTIILVSHDPDEVLYLAEKVFLFAGAPATIVDELEPELPARGKQEIRYTAEFQRSRRQLTGWLQSQE